MAPPSPPDDTLTLLRKVVALEQRQGHKDLAVVGGFSGFATKKLGDLRDLPGYTPARIEEFQRFLGGYKDLDPAVRTARLDELARWLEDPGVAAPQGADRTDDPAPAPGSREQAAPPPSPGEGETPIQYVKGVGPQRARLLARLGIESRRDLLYHLPLRYEDHSHPRPLRDVVAGEEVTVVARIRRGRPVRGRFGRGNRFEATLEDETGSLEAVWFNQAYLSKVLTDGCRVVLHGKVGNRRGRPQLQSPSHEVLADGEEASPGLVPVYPLTEGMYQRTLRRLVRAAVADLADSEEDRLPPAIREDLPPLAEALRALHTPDSEADLEPARLRLAFEELLVLQVALALKQRHEQAPDPEASVCPEGDLVSRLRESLPFAFTGAQENAVGELLDDLAAPRPMTRLLQGDVGSGKTVVAASALAAAIDAGQQGALMAPTEILADQHASTLSRLFEPLGITPRRLLGGMPKADRKDLLAGLVSGEVPLVVGTHALIEPDVEFDHLGLIVIDEQHRFGVTQRAALRGKTGLPNTLVMTATPIPRTLSLTLYGDLDLTVLDEMPPGRIPVETEWKRPRSLPKVWEAVRKEVARGRQAYVVCPLVEESEKVEAQAATDLAAELSQGPLADLQVGLLHGRMSRAEKDAVMTAFRGGEVQVLVATTVIEVGVDVPNATHMVVLNAERFGLAQLHQLRGRVGRGGGKARCTLVSHGGGEDTRRRLKVLVESQDGFRVAEEDLALRGPGEYFGTRQSGLPALRFADLTRDTRLLDRARRTARELVEADPELAAPELAPLARQVREKFARFLESRH
jgi:ATP-dependent DNA helicase RecG